MESKAPITVFATFLSNINPNCVHSYHWLKIYINAVFRPVIVLSNCLTVYRSCNPQNIPVSLVRVL